MNYELSQKFYFEAAHTLQREIDGIGSKRVHGHTYYAEIFMHGTPDSNSGMLIDLGFVRKELEGIREILDHNFLDDIPELGPPTLENLCVYIYKKLKKSIPMLTKVSVWREASGDKCTLFFD
ncbi:MAG: 6-carboxytetrahydropterin synthase [Scytonema hyalinum WJT4-NPBG1]|jgi:6-pyruvoyltetrahydropterin/6-carboxytetrahydropterin synthase|nr:6-carboxytetrahydropterin synthase [Scytonema hyalinum WJT4-NPBG1]